MHGLFPPIDTVELDDVEAFLLEAGEEGVTWEAKADDDETRDRDRPTGEEPGRLRNHTIQKAVCGLANQIGGYLIIGARREDDAGAWRVAGITTNHPEPETWLREVIEGGLAPVPKCEVRAWRLGEARILAIVEVQPVPQPPCMTRQGHIYERVSGRTVRVQDPALLDALRSRGARARDRVYESADDAAQLALAEGHWTGRRSVGVGVGLATVGRESNDVSARLFVPTFQQLMRDALGDIIDAADLPGDADTGGSSVHQALMSNWAEWIGNEVPGLPHTIRIGPAPLAHLAAITVHAMWDGSVSASISLHADLLPAFSIIDQFLVPAWTVLARLVERLGGYGPTQLQMRVRVGDQAPLPRVLELAPDPPPPGTLFANLSDEDDTVLGRELQTPTVDDDQVGSLHRELQRAAGIESFEPETQPDGAM